MDRTAAEPEETAGPAGPAESAVFADPAGPAETADPAGPADPAEDRPGHEALLAEAERVLDAVDGALARLDDGSYGSCEVCGGPVDDETLAAAPTARACRAHLPLADRS